jgi:hypothetical protein
MIALLVPVLGRPHQIKPVFDSITSATSTEHRVIFICSPRASDQVGHDACRAIPEAITITVPWEPGRSDYALKLEAGFDQTDEEWLFQGATDLVFYAGWDVQALAVARQSKCGVIGTNDLGNPLVKRGRHSTHTLFTRDYIETYGGTADNSGRIFSTAYDHQWTDSEFIETATLRRQFAFARRSIVEHLHPHWGKGDMDETYEKAHRATTEDQRLFMRRRAVVHRLEQKRRRGQ